MEILGLISNNNGFFLEIWHLALANAHKQQSTAAPLVRAACTCADYPAHAQRWWYPIAAFFSSLKQMAGPSLSEIYSGDFVIIAMRMLLYSASEMAASLPSILSYVRLRSLSCVSFTVGLRPTSGPMNVQIVTER